jgi:hypothetical protein
MRLFYKLKSKKFIFENIQSEIAPAKKSAGFFNCGQWSVVGCQLQIEFISRTQLNFNLLPTTDH